jgi:hypothetical protein
VLGSVTSHLCCPCTTLSESFSNRKLALHGDRRRRRSCGRENSLSTPAQTRSSTQSASNPQRRRSDGQTLDPRHHTPRPAMNDSRSPGANDRRLRATARAPARVHAHHIGRVARQASDSRARRDRATGTRRTSETPRGPPEPDAERARVCRRGGVRRSSSTRSGATSDVAPGTFRQERATCSPFDKASTVSRRQLLSRRC